MKKRRFNDWFRRLLKFVLFVALMLTAAVFALRSTGVGEIVFGSKIIEEPVFRKSIERDPITEEEYREIKRNSFEKLFGSISKQMEQQKMAVADKNAAKPDLGIAPNELYSENVCLMDAVTGEIIFAIKENQVVYPASLTKIMTTMVAVDQIEDYDQTYVVPPALVEEMIWEDASMAGFAGGETVTVRDLIYGTMLPSGGEAAIGLAEAVSGSEAEHVNKMNEKAHQLGLRKTHFTNVTGLHDDKNVSTAKELAELVRVGLRDEVFKKVFTRHDYISTETTEHPYGVHMMYSVLAYMDSLQPSGYKVHGGKTGYTEQAALCLASTATVGNRDYILVTLGALPYDALSKFHFIDADVIYTALANSGIQ